MTADYKFCPSCEGELEMRFRRIKGEPTEVVYICQGTCGREWSVFDLTLISQTD